MKSLNKRIKKSGPRLGPEYDNFKTEGITQKLKKNPREYNVLEVKYPGKCHREGSY